MKHKLRIHPNITSGYTLILFCIFLIGSVLRLYNLNWGAPFYFHPDERQNIVYPVLSSKSPVLLDQKNFDIGTFPLVVIKQLYPFMGSYLFQTQDLFVQTILTSRFLSALLSLASAIIVYRIAKDYFDKTSAFIAFTLMIFFVGNIQYSHFGTVEVWEAFFIVLLSYVALKISEKPTFGNTLTAGFLTGLAVSTKLLTLVAVPAVIISIMLPYAKSILQLKRKKIIKLLIHLFVYIGIAITVGLIAMPQTFLHFHDFRESVQFESKVAIGTLPVFYTQGFYNTTPVLFQFKSIYPFLINPINTILLIPSLIYMLYLGVKKMKLSYILVAVFLIAIFSLQANFLAKWTRYYIPSLPFIALCIGVFISSLVKNIKNRYVVHASLVLFLCANVFFSTTFFLTVYTNPPTPLEAFNWARHHIPKDAKILVEPYDLGIVPFTGYFHNITFFNFYDLDQDRTLQEELKNDLKTTNYIILPSQRILRSRLLNPQKFPVGYRFYKSLSNEIGYKRVYDTPCNTLCAITYLGNPVFSLEETAVVFDHPQVMILKKK